MTSTFARSIAAGVFLCVASISSFPRGAVAAPGSFDPTFGGGNGFAMQAEPAQIEGVFKAAVAMPDGGVVVAGATETGAFFRRYTSSATLDPGFGTNGTTVVADFPGIVRNLYLQSAVGVPLDHLLRYPDGHFIYSNNGRLLKLSANGVVDPTFRPEIFVKGAQSRPYFLFPRADGGVIFAGGQAVIDNNFSHRVSIRLFNADGARDTVHGGDYGEVLIDPLHVRGTTVTAAIQQPDGKVLVAGFVDNGFVGTDRSLFVLRVDQNGALDPAFAQAGVLVFRTGAGFRYVSQLAVDAAGSGRIAVAYNSTQGGVPSQILVLGSAGDTVASIDVAVDSAAPLPASQALVLNGDRIASLMSFAGGFESQVSAWIGSVSGGIPARTVPLDLTDPMAKTPSWALEGTVALPDGPFWLYGFRGKFDILSSSNIYQTIDSTLLEVTVPGGGGAASIVKAPGLAFPGVVAAEFDNVIALLGQKSLVLERVDAQDSAARTLLLRRFNADGTLDMTYGNGTGRFVLPQTARGGQTFLLRAADGSVYAGAHAVYCINSRTSVIAIDKVRADGTADTAFAVGGTFQQTPPTGPLPAATVPCISEPDPSPTLAADGRLLFVDYGDQCGLRLKRLFPDGRLDTTFGVNGAVDVPAIGCAGFATQFVVGPDSSVTFVIRDLSRNGVIRLQRLAADGRPDTRFGNGGLVVVDDLPVAATPSAPPARAGALALPDGSIVLQVGFSDANAVAPYDTDVRASYQRWLIKYRADGQRDLAFGTQGIVRLHVPRIDRSLSTIRNLIAQPDGKLLVAYPSASFAFNTTTVTRLNADGSFDTTFTSGGSADSIVNVDGAGSAIAGIALSDDGKILLAGLDANSALLVRLNGPVEPQPQVVAVVEFYNADLRHYFLTADPAEATAIDNGAAGAGWQRTGASFVAWSASSAALVGGAPVCRFYGTPGRGPNSHFYTASASECAGVKQDPGWTFEGNAFAAIAPQGDQCPGSVAVYRAYNNGFVRNDSNHRYSTDLAALQAMRAQGWTVEGVAFCAVGK